MKIRILFILLMLFLPPIIGCHASGFLTEDQIEAAHTLAFNEEYFEDYIVQQKQEQNKQDWLTLEEFNFDYKGTNHQFYLANGFYPNNNWGEIAVYPIDVDPTKIYYSFAEFINLGKSASYLATLSYEYIPSEKPDLSYFIAEKANAGFHVEGKSYSQEACLNYFVDEFVTKRTHVSYVFSNLRNPICQHYFPKYGFQLGMIENFKNTKFKRPLQIPASWVRK